MFERMIQTDSLASLNEFYPKIHVVAVEEYTLIRDASDLPEVLSITMLEPTRNADGITKFYSAGKHGGFLVKIPHHDAGGGVEFEVTPFTTTYGSNYADDTWVYLPIPEPTVPLDEYDASVFHWGYDNVYVINVDDYIYGAEMYMHTLPVEDSNGIVSDPAPGYRFDTVSGTMLPSDRNRMFYESDRFSHIGGTYSVTTVDGIGSGGGPVAS